LQEIKNLKVFLFILLIFASLPFLRNSKPTHWHPFFGLFSIVLFGFTNKTLPISPKFLKVHDAAIRASFYLEAQVLNSNDY